MPCVAPNKAKYLCCNNTLILNACSPDLVVPAGPGFSGGGNNLLDVLSGGGGDCGSSCGGYDTVILDASKGSLCDVVIEGPIKNLIVRGGKQGSAYVSVIFRGNALTGSGCSPCTQGGLLAQTPYIINNLIIDKTIHKFEIVGLDSYQGSCPNNTWNCSGDQSTHATLHLPIVSFGTIKNNAKYFTVNTPLSNQCTGFPSSKVLITGNLYNYGHFLMKSRPCATTDLFVRCNLNSTGRNKNFRIPYGILYLNAGANVKLCNVSSECIKGPSDCNCFDTVCYDSDATLPPIINCMAVVCNNEYLPSLISVSQSDPPSVTGENYRNQGYWGCTQTCDDDWGKIGSSQCNPNTTLQYTVQFNNISVQPCFLNKANIEIKCSDILICDIVPRVYSCSLSPCCPDKSYEGLYLSSQNVGGDVLTNQRDVSTAFDTSFCRGGPGQRQQGNTIEYLMNLTIDTAAIYLGQKFNNNQVSLVNCNSSSSSPGHIIVGGNFESTNLNAQRTIFIGANNPWSSQNPQCYATQDPSVTQRIQSCARSYSLMTSKCKSDPIVDPWTLLPRRCSPMNCLYQFHDIVRPVCGFQWAPAVPSPACSPCIPPKVGTKQKCLFNAKYQQAGVVEECACLDDAPTCPSQCVSHHSHDDTSSELSDKLCLDE